MRFRVLVIAVIYAGAIACSQPVNPVAPSSASTVSDSQAAGERALARREVEGGSGGGTECVPPAPCPEGDVFVQAGDATLSGDTFVVTTSDPREFSAHGFLFGHDGSAGQSGTPLEGGHFSAGAVELSVADGIMQVSMTLQAQSRTFEVSGSGPAVQTTGACVAGTTLLTTSVTLKLQYLGKTTVTESHGIACS